MLHIFLLFYYRSGALLTEFSSMGEEGKVPALTRKIMNTDYVIALSNMVRDFYDFAILESSENFLMSDQYVSTVELEVKARFGKISNRHMGLKETIILIPITSSYYAAYWNTNKRGFFLEKDSINRLDKENLKLVNKAIINNSYTKCIGAKKSKIEQTIDNYKDRRPSQIFAGGNPTGYSMGAIKKKEVFLFEQDDKAFHLFRWNPSLKK